MAFQRPSLAALVTRIQQDFVSRLQLVGALLRRAVVYVMARVWAGAAHMMHGHIEYVQRQIFADSCDDENLVRMASLRGLFKTDPEFAHASVDFTGTNGLTIPAGTVLLRSDGAEYTTDADATIAGGVATANVTASLAGSDPTLTAGVVLNFESPIPGVGSTATVNTSLADGSDLEETEAFRVRFLALLRESTHGGNDADYVAWAKLVSGVTRVWPVPLGLGPGTVVVRFVRDNDADFIPDAGEVAAVQAKIDSLRPAHATVTVVAPVAVVLNFTVTIIPNTAATRAAVNAELADLLTRVAKPGGTILLSDIETAVRTATGVTDRVVSLPAADVTHTANQIAKMGTVTFL